MKKLMLLLFSMPCIAFAQVREGGIFTVGFGYANYSMSDWAVFYPDSNAVSANDALNLSFGFDAISNKTVYGLSTSSMFKSKETIDSFDIQCLNTDIKFDIGYLLIHTPKFLCIPTLGLGGGYDNIRIINTNNTTAAAIAANPGREINLNQGKALADFSLQTYFTFGNEFSDNEQNALLIGLQLGYTANYAIGNWRISEVASVSDGPSGFRQMLYARLTVGGFSLDAFFDNDEQPDMQ